MKISLDHTLPYLWQWDLNQRVILSDNEAGVEVHFSNDLNKNALVTVSYLDNGKIYANIPNVLLQRAAQIQVYIYPKEGDKAYTKVVYAIDVLERAKPDNYIYTEDERQSCRFCMENFLLASDYTELEISVPGMETEVASITSDYSSVTIPITEAMVENGLMFREEKDCISYIWQFVFYNDMSGGSVTHTAGSILIDDEGYHADLASMLSEHGYTLNTDWSVKAYFEHIDETVHVLVPSEKTIKVLAKKEDA